MFSDGFREDRSSLTFTTKFRGDPLSVHHSISLSIPNKQYLQRNFSLMNADSTIGVTNKALLVVKNYFDILLMKDILKLQTFNKSEF